MTGVTYADGELFDVAPFVLVVDCSGSMKNAMQSVNRFVPDLIETIREIPEALESVALGVISFNDQARIVRHLTWIDEDITMPQFVAQSRTSYVAPLDRTRELIEKDTPQLGERGFRPVVFFITDAQPNVETESEWLAARASLLNSRLRPKLVTFGFGDVNELTLKTLASDPSLAELKQKAASVAMDEILSVVMNTVITLTSGSGSSSTGGLAGRIIDSERGADDDTIIYTQ